MEPRPLGVTIDTNNIKIILCITRHMHGYAV